VDLFGLGKRRTQPSAHHPNQAGPAHEHHPLHRRWRQIGQCAGFKGAGADALGQCRQRCRQRGLTQSHGQPPLNHAEINPPGAGVRRDLASLDSKGDVVAGFRRCLSNLLPADFMRRL